MYSIYFLQACPNMCSQSQNLGNCRGSAALYSLGRFQIPTGLNNPPNGAILPTTALRYTVVYFKYGYNPNLNSTRSPTYEVNFDIDSEKWNCTCPDFLSRRLAQNTICKHILGCIDLRAHFNRFLDPRYLSLLETHITEN